MKIANRIIAALLAATSFPLLLTQMFINIILSVSKDSTAYTLIKTFAGEDSELLNNRLGFQENLIELWNRFMGKTDSSVGIDLREFLSTLPPEFDSVKKFATASLVFICIGAFIALVVVGCAIFTNAYKTVIGLSLGGSLSFLIAIILFGKGASPILDGTIDLASVVMKILVSQESSLGSIASSVLTGAIHVDSFALGGAVFGPMIMLFATAIWEIAYYVTLPADQKPKRKSREKIKA
ncbi:MAG: hypothetical protein SPI54_01065 [Oscillospiraceae bacterium]|nr:hypothetical protein [Ruminococcus sp.]MDD7337288.1 hypothetical protein [Ruminococcus sp.]MDY6060479.1 hypothetical protein [Oscillospiraceae bacterium]